MRWKGEWTEDIKHIEWENGMRLEIFRKEVDELKGETEVDMETETEI